MKKYYPYGFSTKVDSYTFKKGLSEKVIKKISQENEEGKYFLDFRLKAYRKFLQMKPPLWANLSFDVVDLQDISYYSRPKKNSEKEIKKTVEKLGIDMKNHAVDFVFDSVSFFTSYREKLKKYGVILCSIKEAIQKYPTLVKKYLGSVVSFEDNYYAALNSSVFSDGSFIFVPKGVRCPMELSTYFRINEKSIGQFERTLIIAEEGASLSYLEGCTAPFNKKHQLHAAVVELIALDNAYIKYSTLQNWYSGPVGGVYNFVTKRGLCKGRKSKISWVQVELGSSISWKYPGCILEGKGSIGEFYSIALTNENMQTDTGSKMVHIGEGTSSLILSKGIASDVSKNTYRGLVKILPKAKKSRNYSKCDSMLIGKKCSSFTFPFIDVENKSSIVEHEAHVSKLSEEKLFYLQTRGITKEEGMRMMVQSFCREVTQKLPFEFGVEIKELLYKKLEKSIG